MSKEKKLRIQVSYKIDIVLKEELFWKGATKEEMIKSEIENAKESPEVYLDIGLQNGTYSVAIQESNS